MDITIAARAPRRSRIGRIRQVDEDQACPAPGVAGNRADGNRVLRLLVDDDVVGRPLGQSVEMVDILGIAEDDGVGRVDVEQLDDKKEKNLSANLLIRDTGRITYLRHVEDLHSVARGFTADDHVVLVATDLAPSRGRGVLR